MDRVTALLMRLPDPVGSAATLDLKRAVACEMIDRAAGTARLRWSSAYPFQDEEYRLAADQAAACQADGSPDPADYPTLQADVAAGTVDPRSGLPVADLAEAADLILFKRDLYMTALADIRTARLGAKAVAKTAADEPAIRAAIAVAWPAP